MGGAVRCTKEFTLYGGTGLALHLGHRKSVDFDFFGRHAIDVASLESEIPFLKGAAVIQREKNTLTAIVDRGEPVKVSFFGVPKLPRLAPPAVARDNGLKIDSLLDLAGTKASVLQVRAEAKDYIDMDALIRTGGVDLPFALTAAQKLYGPPLTRKSHSRHCRIRRRKSARPADRHEVPTGGSGEQGGSGPPTEPG